MNSSDRCAPGSSGPAQVGSSGSLQTLADGEAASPAPPGVGDMPKRSTSKDAPTPITAMPSTAAAAYASTVPARRTGDGALAEVARWKPRSTSGSTSSAIRRGPSRRRSSIGLPALAFRLAEQGGQAQARLEDVHLGRGVRAAQDLCHLGQRPVLVVVERARRALLRRQATHGGGQVQ